MTTKTTDLWLSRDPDGSYWVSEDEPTKVRVSRNDWWWDSDEFVSVLQFHTPALRKGTKRRIRVTVEVLR